VNLTEFLKEGKIDKELAKAAKDNTKKDDDAEVSLLSFSHVQRLCLTDTSVSACNSSSEICQSHASHAWDRTGIDVRS
jgi:hypothetical protein